MKVSILLATYKPNWFFFKKLLQSLNNQTYKNLELCVRDDSDSNNYFEEIKRELEKYITNFPYSLTKNDKNIGSNKTFEALTIESEGDYLAYCDQDDIWHTEKIAELVTLLQSQNAVLAYSDLKIIDENGRLISESFKKVNKRINYQEGEGLFDFFLRRNCVTGCAMLIRKDVAKSAVPFCSEYYVHDNWLALESSRQGSIAYTDKKLVFYRLHANNQIGGKFLHNINSSKDYYEKVILKEHRKYRYLLSNYNFSKKEINHIKKNLSRCEIRINFFKKNSILNFLRLIRCVKYDWQKTLFELFLAGAPERIKEYFIAGVKGQ